MAHSSAAGWRRLFFGIHAEECAISFFHSQGDTTLGGGAHEWIPVSTIVEAYKPRDSSPAALGESVRWLNAAETWTTPTTQLFIKPEKRVGRLPDSTGTIRNVLQGHPGAVYHFNKKGENKPQTQGSPGLHKPLAQAVRGANGSVDKARAGIEAAANEFMWTGKPALGSDFSNEHRGSGGNILSKAELSRRASTGFIDFSKVIKRSLR